MQCRDTSTSASSPIIDSTTVSDSAQPQAPQQQYSETMDTLSSPSFGGCTASTVVCSPLYIGFYLFVIFTSESIWTLLAGVVYAWAHLAQCGGALRRAQVAQVLACVVFAVLDRRPVLVVIAIMASMGHVAYAIILLNAEYLGDCRTCCNESYKCRCGKDKKTLPQGSLRELARLIDTRRVLQMESR